MTVGVVINEGLDSITKLNMRTRDSLTGPSIELDAKVLRERKHRLASCLNHELFEF